MTETKGMKDLREWTQHKEGYAERGVANFLALGQHRPATREELSRAEVNRNAVEGAKREAEQTTTKPKPTGGDNPLADAMMEEYKS